MLSCAATHKQPKPRAARPRRYPSSWSMLPTRCSASVRSVGGTVRPSALAVLRRQQANAMVLTQHSLFYHEAKAIADLSLKYRLPVLSGDTGFAAAGGLIK